VKFGFLQELVMKISIFTHMIPFTLTHRYQRFGVICCILFCPEFERKLHGIASKLGKVIRTRLLQLATVNYYSNVVQYLAKLHRSSVVTSAPIISTVTAGSTCRTTSTPLQQLCKCLSLLINSSDATLGLSSEELKN
jgi:hypothetical protein